MPLYYDPKHNTDEELVIWYHRYSRGFKNSSNPTMHKNYPAVTELYKELKRRGKQNLVKDEELKRKAMED